ncbi:MAG: sulfatase/phosphatase domain-containing protein [Clostridium paraputrificum]
MWNPRYKRSGERTMSLAQTIDISPTLLDFFNVSVDMDMDGKSLTPIIKEDKDIRETALFGVHGVPCKYNRW